MPAKAGIHPHKDISRLHGNDGMNPLENFIRQIIKKKGPIPFSAFMALALYHEKWGYYSKNASAPDYYTNADVHPLFAQILAQYFVGFWKENLGSENLNIVELGPGPGKL